MSTGSGGAQQPPYGQYGHYGQPQGQQGSYGQPMPPQSAQRQQPAYPGGPDPYGYLHNPTPNPPQSYPQGFPPSQNQAQAYYQGPPSGYYQGPSQAYYQGPPQGSQSYQQNPPQGYGYATPQGYQQYPPADPSQALAQGLAQVDLGVGGYVDEARKSTVNQSGSGGLPVDNEPPTRVPAKTEDGTDKGLIGDAIKKHKKKKKHRSDDEESESDDSDSSSSDDSDSSSKKKKKKKHKKKTSIGKPSKKSKPKYFFSNIADEDNYIRFNVKCRADGSDNLVLRSDEDQIAYSILFGHNDFTGEMYRESLFAKNNDQRIRVGAWSEHVWRSEKLKFVFPATYLRDKKDTQEWGFDPDDQEFGSDIGFLGDVFMKWTFSKKAPKGAYNCAFQCDRTDGGGNGAIVWVVVDSYYDASINTDAAYYKNQEELDEMMVIAFAVFDRIRDGCFSTAQVEGIKDKHYKDIKSRRKVQKRGD